MSSTKPDTSWRAVSALDTAPELDLDVTDDLDFSTLGPDDMGLDIEDDEGRDYMDDAEGWETAPRRDAPAAPIAGPAAAVVPTPIETPDDDVAPLISSLQTSDEMVGEPPLPRLTIAAFCDRPEVARLIQSIAADRRLVKTTVTVQMGGAGAAAQALANQASPNLLLLDLQAPGKQLLDELDRVAQYVDSGTKAVVIGRTNDIALYRELMRRGVSEYIVPPLEPRALIQAIASLYANPDQPFMGRVAAIIGAKGGVGSSTVAQNLSWAIAERYQANITLVDLDHSFGTTGLNFDQDTDMGAGEALQRASQLDPVFLERMLIKHTDRLSLLPSSAALDRELEIEPEAAESLIYNLRQNSPFVLLDLPHMWTRWVRSVVVSADDVLIVTTPDLAGLRNAKNMCENIRAARPNDSAPVVVLNMAGVPRRPEIPFKDFAEALGVEPFISVPFDPATFGGAANNGRMVMDMAPESKPAQALDAVARALCGREPAPKRKLPPLLERLPALMKR
jgi:pilus assembly protein CpaE